MIIKWSECRKLVHLPFSYCTDEILAKIHEAGFTIALSKEVQLSKEQAAEFYREHEGQPYFEQLSEAMSR